MTGLGLSAAFVAADRVPDPVPAGFTPWEVIWTADHDAKAAQQVIARNARVGAALAARFGQVTETPRGQLDPEELMVLSDDALPPEAMIHRLARRRVWSFRPDGPVTEVSLCLFDGMATADLQVEDAAPARRAEIAALIDRIAEVLRHEAAMSLWDYQNVSLVPDAPGDRVVLQAAPMLDRQATTARNARLRRRAGPAMAALLTLAFLGATFFALHVGLDRARLAAPAPDAQAVAFVTLEVPQDEQFRIFPDYALIGTVNGERIALPVRRPEYIRAAVGARFSVLPTGDPDRPYILLSQAGSTALNLPIGAGRAPPLHIMLIAAGLSALWATYVLRPLLVRPPRFDRITRSGLALAKACGILAIVFVVGVMLRRF